MKKFISAFLCVCFAAFSLCAFCGCTQSAHTYSDAGYFGALLKIVAYSTDKKFDAFVSDVDGLMDGLDAALDEDESGSDIARFNASSDGEKTEVSEETYALFSDAKEIYALTDGAYNPCVYYLVDLWGFSARFSDASSQKHEVYDRTFGEDGSYPLPETKYIEAFVKLCDFDKLSASVSDGKYYLEKNGTAVTLDGITYYTKIDLGGIAKGYAAEKIADIMKDAGITRGYVNFGTSSLVLLDNKDGDNWNLTLTNPRRDGDESDVYCSLPLKNSAVATSGDYERYYYTDGRRYCHIIDAATGYPVDNGVATVTVTGGSAEKADAVATALMVGGKEKTIAFSTGAYAAENGLKIIAVFIENGGMKIYSTAENLTLNAGETYEE
jgi:thiamine biosynthesis lipoprotein